MLVILHQDYILSTFERSVLRTLSEADFDGFALMGFPFRALQSPRVRTVHALICMQPGVVAALEILDGKGVLLGSASTYWTSDDQRIQCEAVNPHQRLLECRKAIHGALHSHFPEGQLPFVQPFIVVPEGVEIEVEGALVNSCERGHDPSFCHLNRLVSTLGSLWVSRPAMEGMKTVDLNNLACELTGAAPNDIQAAKKTLVRQSTTKIGSYARPAAILSQLAQKSGRVVLRNSIVRLCLLLGVGLAGAVAISQATYRGYWDTTIRRVQTVDFNILSQILPYKLSSLLIKGNKPELQQTLNSNFGLFSIVVTDASGKKIIAATHSRSKIDPQAMLAAISDASYDQLLDPPPLLATRRLPSPRASDSDWIKTGRTNPGKVIGRMYLLRGQPKPFQEDLWVWIKNPLSSSSTNQHYMLIWSTTLLLSFSLWLAIELVVLRSRNNRSILLKKMEWKKEEAIRDSIRREKDAAKMNQILQQQAEERLAQIEELTGQSESERQKAHQQAMELKSRISDLERMFSTETDVAADVRVQEQISLLRRLMQAAESDAEAKQRSLENLAEEHDRMMDASNRSELNGFESKIQEIINSELQQEHYLLPQYDCAKPGKDSRFIDFVLALNGCVICVEVKNYDNEIVATGNVRNSSWVSRASSLRDVTINPNTISSRNPYHQVKNGGDALRSVLKDKLSEKIPAYGIVVFSGRAEISDAILEEFSGGFHRVATARNLIDVINQLASEASRWSCPLSAQEIRSALVD